MVNCGLHVVGKDRPGLLRDVAACVATNGGNIESVNHTSGIDAELHLEVSGLRDMEEVLTSLSALEGVSLAEERPAVGTVFGKRVIVIGGGAQVAQVVLGAVSEADRHNIRGERISVDTIPLVGEQRLADAVRAVARLPRAKILVLAGSLMGGDISNAVRELQAQGVPVISLNMVGSVTGVADLVVSDPVQAGTIAVMAIAETASFDLAKARGKQL